MQERGMLDHTIIHGVLVGPARSGKDSLMHRLLGETPSSESMSTGVVERVVQVEVPQKSIQIATRVEESIWSRMDFDENVVQTMKNIFSCDTVAPNELLMGDSEQNSAALGKDILHEKVKDEINESSPAKSSLPLVSPDNHHKMSQHCAWTSLESTTVATVKPPDVSPQDILMQSLTKRDIQNYFKKNWSLYLTNTGGQIEFQEVLPLLVTGPCIFIFTFRLDRDLNQLYSIEYGVSSEKISNYVSKLTTMEMILQTLTSIAAMGTFVYKGLKRNPLRPKIFFVGTHKDQLNTGYADDHISKVDKELQERLMGTAHYEKLIEFASESQMMFSVNNFSEDDSDFCKIRFAIERAIKRDQLHMTSPAHWLIFSLALQELSRKSNIISYDHCLKVANECGLKGDELSEALDFIHSKMGLIRYYPFEDLKELVILNTQFLFDKVTELIVNTFTFEKAGKQATDKFKNFGIFSASDFQNISAIDRSGMTPLQFGKLLEHLRIVAPFVVDKEEMYFFPCALAHTEDSKFKRQRVKKIQPLLISFNHGYYPKGVAGAFIAYLISTKKDTWEFLSNEVFRDQVSFCVGSYCDFVSIKMLHTHFEIEYFLNSMYDEGNRPKEWSLKNACTEVQTALFAGIIQVLKDMNYVNTKPLLTFKCECETNHPAVLKYFKGSPCLLWCKTMNKTVKLPASFDVWGLTEPSSGLGQFRFESY